MIDALLPIFFASLMGLSMLLYAILDGYDLGTGMLMALADDDEKDLMIGSIGPFWDANETWLVFGVGLLLVAFPKAHGIILTHLYLPTALMLIGLILRGVAFDFRAKAHINRKKMWNRIFITGSTIAAFAQGFMLGSYILGFQTTWKSIAFSILVGICLIAGYCLIGACWLISKTENKLQTKSVAWAKRALIGTTIGIGLVSIVTPLVSARIFDSWFSFPNIILLAPIPLITAFLIFTLFMSFRIFIAYPLVGAHFSRLPFALTVWIFALSFNGLAYSFYPYIIPEQLTIQEAASAPAALRFVAVGVSLVFPVLVAYTFFCYRVFRGKARYLAYD